MGYILVTLSSIEDIEVEDKKEEKCSSEIWRRKYPVYMENGIPEGLSREDSKK